MIEIRCATAEDAARIAHIHVASWRAAYRALMPDDYLAKLDEDRRAVFWSKRLAESRGEVTVSESGGEVAGFCDLIPSRDPEADSGQVGEIAALYVLPEHWRKGMGTTLCVRAFDKAQSLGFSAVTLWVLESNTAAIRFYERMNFRPDGARKTENLTSDFSIQEVRFRLDLPPRGILG